MIIIFLPFLGFLLSFFMRFLGKQFGSIFIMSCVGLAFVNALIMFNTVCIKNLTQTFEITWMNNSYIKLNFMFQFDILATVLTLLITFTTFLVMLYSIAYLDFDPSI